MLQSPLGEATAWESCWKPSPAYGVLGQMVWHRSWRLNLSIYPCLSIQPLQPAKSFSGGEPPSQDLKSDQMHRAETRVRALVPVAPLFSGTMSLGAGTQPSLLILPSTAPRG